MKVKINVIKFETVNGKKMGKAFSFPIDAKEMAKHKTEATVRKKVEEYILKSKVFTKEEIKDLRYDMKDFMEEWKKQKQILEEELIRQSEASDNVNLQRITPEHITRLGGNEIFVFGSNARGLHHGGAARAALNHFGAILGQGHGLQGKSYAIDSMSGIPAMEKDVRDFHRFAQQNPQMHFLVTPIGCGIAGYRAEEIAPLFASCAELENVSLPSSFWKVLGGAPGMGMTFNLERFVEAQAHSYSHALAEITSGRKTSHWIWYIFPQQKGLGHSYNSEFYGLDGIDEARAYWEHPLLGARLREMCQALLTHKDTRDIDTIMGSHIDVLKLQTCMNLFNKVAPGNIFQQVLDAFF